MSAMTAGDPRFKAWLSRETGIDASALGVNALERAVLGRVRLTRAEGEPGDARHPAVAAADDGAAQSVANGAIDAYWQLLNTSPDERQALIEALVVPETWFFRDREAFDALVRIANERLAREPSHVLRVLSAPCSTGEEPYSIAMALLDAGIDAARFTVDALDISAGAIERARRGVYGRNSFRGHALAFRERHFSATAGGWMLDERVRQAVRFAQANLFDLAHGAEPCYDLIYCRNVLIYFHRDAQDRAVRLLEARLADGGTIFVGPAETGLMMRHAMTSARIPLAFAFHRARLDDMAYRDAAGRAPGAQGGHQAGKLRPIAALRAAPAALGGAARIAPPASVAAPTAVPQIASAGAPVAALVAAPVGAVHAGAVQKQPVTPPVPVHPKPPLSLDAACGFADVGHLDEAERLAHEFVIERGPDAGAFHLLGLIADARGKHADARDFYRKALYLDPARYETLTHLAALLDVIGDSAGARQLMRRAQRAATQAPTPGKAHANHLRGSHGAWRS